MDLSRSFWFNLRRPASMPVQITQRRQAGALALRVVDVIVFRLTASTPPYAVPSDTLGIRSSNAARPSRQVVTSPPSRCGPMHVGQSLSTL
jgi:hypothetical protein